MSDSALNQDFLGQLATTLDAKPEAVLALLGDWLVNYRPQRRYELNFLSPTASVISSLSGRAA